MGDTWPFDLFLAHPHHKVAEPSMAQHVVITSQHFVSYFRNFKIDALYCDFTSGDVQQAKYVLHAEGFQPFQVVCMKRHETGGTIQPFDFTVADYKVKHYVSDPDQPPI